MPEVMHCVGPETVVVSLQNGIGNDEILMKYVPRTRIMYGAGVIGTELAGPGCCVSKPEDGVQMFFGAVEKSPETDAAGKYLEECFEAGGCHARLRGGRARPALEEGRHQQRLQRRLRRLAAQAALRHGQRLGHEAPHERLTLR